MGRIWFSATDYVATLADICGFKSGVSLSLKRLRQILRSAGPDAYEWPKSMDHGISLRAEDFEDTIHHVLYSLGAIRTRNPSFLPHEVLQEVALNPATTHMAEDLMTAFGEATRRSALRNPGQPIDLTPVFEDMVRLHGRAGFDLARRFVDAVAEAVSASPWGRNRGVDWQDVVDLDDLFKREDLATAHGRYFDLRFINYLHRNFGDIDRVNWRMFERLTAEFFERAGFQVNLGPGRGDGGVDVRAELNVNGRILSVLVQCKRYKENVGPGVVKELWAEVDWEGRSRDVDPVGLLVTTSRFTPGAQDLVTARRYPILEVDRDRLKQWVEAMHRTRNPIL